MNNSEQELRIQEEKLISLTALILATVILLLLIVVPLTLTAHYIFSDKHIPLGTCGHFIVTWVNNCPQLNVTAKIKQNV